MKRLQPLPFYQNLSFPISYELLPLFLMSHTYLLVQCRSTDFLHLECNSNALVDVFVLLFYMAFSLNVHRNFVGNMEFGVILL